MSRVQICHESPPFFQVSDVSILPLHCLLAFLGRPLPQLPFRTIIDRKQQGSCPKSLTHHLLPPLTVKYKD